jgi:hypothetical protein
MRRDHLNFTTGYNSGDGNSTVLLQRFLNGWGTINGEGVRSWSTLNPLTLLILLISHPLNLSSQKLERS